MKTRGTLKHITRTVSRIFAVGDIHGCAEELAILLDFLHDEKHITTDDQLVFIGDFVDRGPDSKGVLDLLIKLRTEHPDTVYLKGNHEEMMLSYLGLGSSDRGKSWLANGGRQTLVSFSLKVDAPGPELQKQIPQEYLTFLRSLDDYAMHGKYLFAHAGLNPNLPYDEQFQEDLFWIRNDFIGRKHSFERTVLFGHTPYQDIMLDEPYKIALDTGLVYGNLLSCVELTGREVYQVAFGEDQVRPGSLNDYPQSGISR